MSHVAIRHEVMEQHPFKPGQDNYLCASCHKPRAVHLFDGFLPNPTPPACCMRQWAKYSRHLYWYPPGSLKNKKDKPGPDPGQIL